MSNEIAELIQKSSERVERLESEHSALKSEMAAKIAGLTTTFIEAAQQSPGGVPAAPAPRLASAVKSALNSDAVRRFAAGESITSGKVELAVGLKSLTSLQNSPLSEPAGVDITRDDRGVMLQTLKPTRVFESLPVIPTNSNAVGFNKIGFASGTNSAGYQDGEGEEKTEQELVAEWIDAPVCTVAVHSTLSVQVLDDAAQLQNAVSNLLRYGLTEKVDRELLSGPGTARTMNGLLTQASAFVAASSDQPAADKIGNAAALLAGLGYAPQIVYLNPADWFAIQSERDAEGRYVANGWANPNGPSIYGLQAIATASIPPGEALVLDPSIATMALRSGPTVEFSREHNGNFTKNLVTILAEIRAALLVMDPAGMLKIDL
jgi:HK97 family phage major capsid protein